MVVTAQLPLGKLRAPRRWWGLLLTLVALVHLNGCTADEEETGSVGLGGGGGSAGTGGEGGQGGVPLPDGANPLLPRTLPIPYVTAGSGGSIGDFELSNAGDLVAEGPSGADLAWALEGDARLTIVEAPARVEPGQSGALVLSFAGADEESIAVATLTVQVGEQSLSAQVYGVAGPGSLEAGTWETVELPGGHPCGQGLTIGLPTAPFPHDSAGFTDDTVRIFLGEGHRDAGMQDMVVHFHGHGTSVAETLVHHQYEQHLCASGVNGILIIPQGPVETSSGNFGRLMDEGGLGALLQQVLVVLYREQAIVSPVIDQLVLTAHSGGYAAVAANLDVSTNAVPVSQIHLYDAVCAYVSIFAEFADGGGVLRSNYTSGGGTVEENESLISTLEQWGHSVVESVSQGGLRDAPIVIYPAHTSHRGATRIDGAFGEALRFGLTHHRRGPRVELREVVAEGGIATVSWLSPYDDDLLGFAVQTSGDSESWTTVAEVSSDTASVTFPLTGPTRVRVLPLIAWLPRGETLGSDIYPVAGAQSSVLVVDGFDRVLDGSFGGLSHDFAALVGEASGRSVGGASNEAILEGGMSLDGWPAVIWLLGDESTDDHSLNPAEQTLLNGYLSGGGRLLLSGSEVAFDIDGAALLGNAFGASYYADNSESHTFVGTGPLAGFGPFAYAGASAPYAEDYPDVLDASGGTRVLEYGSGPGAAVGIASQAALVGFPLELIDDPGERATTVSALIDFVDP